MSSVFRNPDGSAYWIDGYVFQEPDGTTFTSYHSRKSVIFPWVPEEPLVVEVGAERTDGDMLAAIAKAEGRAVTHSPPP